MKGRRKKKYVSYVLLRSLHFDTQSNPLPSSVKDANLHLFFSHNAFSLEKKINYTYLVTNIMSVAPLALQDPLMGLNPLWQDLFQINFRHLFLVLLGGPHNCCDPFIKHRLGRRMIHLDLSAFPKVVAHPTVLVP